MLKYGIQGNYYLALIKVISREEKISGLYKKLSSFISEMNFLISREIFFFSSETQNVYNNHYNIKFISTYIENNSN